MVNEHWAYTNMEVTKTSHHKLPYIECDRGYISIEDKEFVIDLHISALYVHWSLWHKQPDGSRYYLLSADLSFEGFIKTLMGIPSHTKIDRYFLNRIVTEYKARHKGQHGDKDE